MAMHLAAAIKKQGLLGPPQNAQSQCGIALGTDAAPDHSQHPA